MSSTEVKPRSTITKEQLESMLDKTNRKINITDEALNIINTSINEPEFDGFGFVDTLITYQTALNGNARASLEDYVNAVKFCSFLDAYEGNNVQAYTKTFINRDFVKERIGLHYEDSKYKELCYAASRYRKTPLVVNILTQAEVPLYLLFQGYRYKAVGVLVDRMENSKSDRDKINAASKLLEHVKPPEGLQLEVDFKVDGESIVDKYQKAMEKMVEEQQKLIANGADISKVINVKASQVVEAEIVGGN